MEKKQSKKKLWVVLGLAMTVILVLLGYYLWQNGFSVRVPELLGGNPVYQAVFLANGQVYFGQASNLNANYVTLKDVYYLQVNQNLQSGGAQSQQQISLAKLGAGELHLPKDEMKINRDHIIFIEDIRDESQVIQAIERYKADQAK